VADAAGVKVAETPGIGVARCVGIGDRVRVGGCVAAGVRAAVAVAEKVGVEVAVGVEVGSVHLTGVRAQIRVAVCPVRDSFMSPVALNLPVEGS
jgi:hypothetical protein